MAKKNELLTQVGLSTGYMIQDVILGTNVRDSKGNLINPVRGIPLNAITVLSGPKGTGKSTYIGNLIGNIVRKYPIKRVVIYDSDVSYTYQRLLKTTKLPMAKLVELVRVVSPEDNLCLESMEAELYKFQKEDAKEPEVEFVDPQGVKRKMKPINIFVVDSLTSLTIKDHLMSEGSKEVTNAADMQKFLKYSTHVTRILPVLQANNLNAVYLVSAHIQPKNDVGKTVNAKEFGFKGNDTKSNIPERLRQLAGNVIEMKKVISTGNPDSDSHPRNKYAVSDDTTGETYGITCSTAKSRTSRSGMSEWNLMYTNGSFNEIMHIVASAVDSGVFKKGTGLYPSADSGNPYNLKSKKTVLNMEYYIDETGAYKPFNVEEAKYRLGYQFEVKLDMETVPTEFPFNYEYRGKVLPIVDTMVAGQSRDHFIALSQSKLKRGDCVLAYRTKAILRWNGYSLEPYLDSNPDLEFIRALNSAVTAHYRYELEVNSMDDSVEDFAANAVDLLTQHLNLN
ncbi:MAG: hypothetical protein ACRCX2_38950 [Paraclostridium sp.]